MLFRGLNIMTFLYRLPALFIGLTFHEAAHAFAADRLGDDTPRLRGRLTLDPFAHIDWLGVLMLLIAGFGWAKPVPVNSGRFKKPRRDLLLVAAAGPAANLLIAFVSAGILFFLLSRDIVIDPLYHILDQMITLDLALCAFNLIPIPPLDGFKVLSSLIRTNNMRFWWNAERYGPMILMLVIFLGLANGWISRVVGFLMNLIFSFYGALL